MKKIVIVIVGIFFAVGLLSMMNGKPSLPEQVQIEEEPEPEAEDIQAVPKTHPSPPEEFIGLTEEDELPKGLADEDVLPLVNGERPTVQAIRDFGVDRARKLVVKLPELQPWKSELKLDEHANVQPAEHRDHTWKVYGRVEKTDDKLKASPFMWIAYVSFDGKDVDSPYRLVQLAFK